MKRRVAVGAIAPISVVLLAVGAACIVSAQSEGEPCEATRTGDIVTIDLSTCEVTPSTSTPPTTVAPSPTTTVAPTTTEPPATTTTAPATTTSTLPPTTSSTQPPTTTTAPSTGGGDFLDTFNGPASPTPVPFGDSTDWDVTVYTRDLQGQPGAIFPTHADHGAGCSGPPDQHHVTAIADLVFQCGADDNRHLMTAIDGGEYGQITLSPNAVLDFADGGVVEWDVSSQMTSERDWWDVWIVPATDTRDLACDPHSYFDGDGPCTVPANGINVKIQTWEDNSPALDRVGLETWVYRNGNNGTLVNSDTYHSIYDYFAPSAARRDKYRVTLTPTSVETCIVAYDKCYADATFAALGWTKARVLFIHHSYNPTKDGSTAARPGSWHWDNIRLSPVT